MADYIEIKTPLIQVSGENKYKLLLETSAEMVITEAGTSVQETLDEIDAELAEVGGTTPWTAYGDGVDAAPEELHEAGVYVSDEADAPEETAQSAVLRQKRDDELVPIFPRTAAELVSVAVDGIEATDVAGALSELVDGVNAATSDAANAQATADEARAAAATAQTTADTAQSTADTAASTASENATAIEGLTSTVTTVQGDVSDLQTAVQNIETQVEAVECSLVSAAVELEEDVDDGAEVETAGVGYKPGNGSLMVFYEGVKCILGRQYEETEANGAGYATSIKIKFDAESGATFEFVALNGVMSS